MKAKIPTKKLRELGIKDNIIIRKGAYGFYLYDNMMTRGQAGALVYKQLEDCVQAAKRGEFPKSTYIGSVHEYNM